MNVATAPAPETVAAARARRAAQKRARYLANRTRILRELAARRAENPELFAERGRAWRSTLNGCLTARANTQRARCRNPKAISYPHYGAKGVEWRFQSLKECVSYLTGLPNVGKVQEGWQIDRIRADGHYERGNLQVVPQVTNLFRKGKPAQAITIRARGHPPPHKFVPAERGEVPA